jgi:hypothetical protein
MPNEFRQRVARLNKQELDDMPAPWTRRERGHHLRRLLADRGIDPNRLYRVEYFPHRACWLFTQDAEPRSSSPVPAPAAPSDEAFYLQISLELRRSALSALARHRAMFGTKYQLPPEPQELSPADLVSLIGKAGEGQRSVRFDGEGGWQMETRDD